MYIYTYRNYIPIVIYIQIICLYSDVKILNNFLNLFAVIVVVCTFIIDIYNQLNYIHFMSILYIYISIVPAVIPVGLTVGLIVGLGVGCPEGCLDG